MGIIFSKKHCPPCITSLGVFELFLVLMANYIIPRNAEAAFVSSQIAQTSPAVVSSTLATPAINSSVSHTKTISPGIQVSPFFKKQSGIVLVPQKELNKYSTATDVLQYLNASNQLAPYAAPNGVAVVTGGSGGIGAATIQALAWTGMKVVLCARNPFATRKVLEGMHLTSKYFNIRVQSLDLSDLNSVQNAVDEIARVEGNVDLVVNNAGINSLPTRQVTSQSLEMQFGVNHVGHFFLTRALLPHMNEGGRVVTVASNAHSTIRTMRLDNLNSNQAKYSPWYAYSQSKLCNILFAKGLQERLLKEGSDIVSLCLHPGIVMTKLWRHSDHALVGAVSDYVSSKSAEQGAATSVFCSLADASNFKGGEYFMDCQVVSPSKNGMDRSLINGLWDATESIIRKSGFTLPEKLVSGH